MEQESIVIKKNKWYVVITLGVLFTIALASCKPAEMAVDPAELTQVAAEVEESIKEEKASEVDLASIEGGITTDSGLVFIEVSPGDGPTPKEGDIVTMNFIASLPDGTEIGNSYMQGGPSKAIIGRGHLLPGWEEGVLLMKAGSTARLVLPPELAFGSEGYGIVPPDSQIILVIELLSVESAPEPAEISQADLTTTESGLQYYDVTVGEGDEALEGDIVSTHFTLWVQEADGSYYVGSSNDGSPVTFEQGKEDTVFPGWEEGVLNMKVGGKRLLVIPPELGLGETGAGEIPPNATLLLEIELVEVREPVVMTEVDEQAYTTTESGLKYVDLVEGDGPTAETGQTVTVHYTGWLEDGTKFDSSLDAGQPFTFQLGAGMVIPGWEEGVTGMKVGGKRQLVIPSELGYGDSGAGMIPPGATLIFEVELIAIQE